jgi:hypothetical protein
MIAEVVRIIGPNSQAINANREFICFQYSKRTSKDMESCFLCLFLGYRTNGAEFIATDPVFPPWGGDLK